MSITKHHSISKQLVEGRIKVAAGKTQCQAGKPTGSKAQEIKGGVRELGGKVEKTASDLKDDLRVSGKH